MPAVAATPLISVILVCKNPGPRLADALASVWAQRDVALEVIVIDGASTDGSVAWLERHRAQLTHFSSTPDTGVYDAMNRAVTAARGDWVLFLGADDRLVGERVLAEVAGWLRVIDADVAGGEAAFADGRIYRYRPETNPVARNFVHHQAAFYRRRLFAEHGPFDSTLAVMGDYEFNARILNHGARFRSIPVRVATCRPGGLSDGGAWSGYREEITVRHRHFGLGRSLVWDAASVVRFLRKTLVRRRKPFAYD